MTPALRTLSCAAAFALLPTAARADTLYVDPGAPFWVHALAALALFAHIGGGAIGIASGAAALAFRKGDHLHRIAGTVFFVSMLAMAGVAAPVAALMGDDVNVVAAIFTLYLLATAWLTAKRRDGRALPLLDAASLFTALAIAAIGVAFVLEAQTDPSGMEGAPPQANYVFATMATCAAAGDLHLLIRRGLAGTSRIARHLWRMCLALFIATGSLFLGQQQVFPEALQGSVPLLVLGIAPLGFLIFWLIRIRWPKPAAARP